MNTNQKGCTLVALTAVIATLFLAPWRMDLGVVGGVTLFERDYAPIFPSPHAEGLNARIDVSLLFVEWLAIGILYGLLLQLFRDKKVEDKNEQTPPQK